MRAAILALLCACSAPAPIADAGIDAGTDASLPPRCPGPFAAPTDAELALRRQLGIPDEAECAVVLAQTSHLDVDWRDTFDGYYSAYVGGIFSDAHDLLAADPAYRYQACEMSFVAEHARQHPEQMVDLRDAASRGALRIVGGGITSPDTLLPTTEALVRDYLRGSLAAESLLGVSPRTAWLPDSFGHSPTVPDLLAGMGYESVAFARVDGLHDAFEAAVGQPEIVEGSTAALLGDLGSADFVWVGPGGGEVLAHWMPIRTYCQGDNLDHTGNPAPGGFVLGEDRSADAAYTNGQIASFVRELTPYSRTPYLFVPIGCDFEPPRPTLMATVARWNEQMYPSTGIYVAAATFEDYADLLADRRADLPRMERDIAPYFTGYFGSRLAVKAAAREAGDRLSQAEAAALIAQELAGASWPADELASSWDLFARSNHHDFIAGTSYDAVVTDEQMPLLEAIETDADAMISASLSAIGGAIDPGGAAAIVVLGTIGAAGPRLASAELALAPGIARSLGADVPVQIAAETRHSDGTIATATLLAAVPDVAPLSWRRIELRDEVPATGPASIDEDAASVTLRDASTGLSATIDRATGLLSALDADGASWLSGPSLEIREWADRGGLYRIGSETQSCTFREVPRTAAPVIVTVLELGPVRARVRIEQGTIAIEIAVVAGARRLDVSATAQARSVRTLTMRVRSSASGAGGIFVHAAGSIARPPERLYQPTFWPVVRAMDLARADGSGIALLPRVSTGASYASDGSFDVMIGRNARQEQCDLLGASGTEIVRGPVSFALRPHASSIDALAEALALLEAPATQIAGGAGATQGTLVALGGAGWVLSAAKRAERGAGVVLRFERTGDGEISIGPELGGISRIDLLERGDAAVTSPIAIDAPLITLRLTR